MYMFLLKVKKVALCKSLIFGDPITFIVCQLNEKTSSSSKINTLL